MGCWEVDPLNYFCGNDPRGLQVVSLTQLVLVRDHLPFPPSPPPPSEDLHVKTSPGMQRYVMSFVGG